MNAASVGTRCASGTRGAGRTYRTRGTGCTVMHHKGSGRSIREVDGIGVVQTAGRRTGNRHNTAAILTIGAVGAVLTVQHIEGVRAVEVRDGHLCAGGCGSGHYNRRETIRAVGAVLTGRTGRTLGTLLSSGTGRTLRTLLSVAQHIALNRAVGHRHHQHVARVGRCHRDGRHVARAGSVQGVRNAQQLLHALDAVVHTAIGVDFRLQVERSHPPRNLAEVLARVASTHLNREEAVHIRHRRVRLRIDRRTRGAALQNRQTDGDVLLRHQGVVAVAHHRLIAHPLRRLRKQGRHGEHHYEQKGKDLFHNFIFLLNTKFSNSPFRRPGGGIPFQKPSHLP